MNALLALTALTGFAQGPSIDQYTQQIKDLAFSMDVRGANVPALKKISGDFADAYRFDHMTFKIKDSFQIRGETKVDDISVLMIMNDGIRVFKAPGKGSFKMDVRKKPGQRQTIFEFGLVTPQLFDDFMVSRFVRNDRATGEAVFDVNFNPKFGDKTRYRIWVDSEKRFTSKKEWYGQDGNLKATFLFTNPEKVGSYWVPTIASVKNSEGTVAGTLSYSRFKINAGMDDSIFK